MTEYQTPTELPLQRSRLLSSPPHSHVWKLQACGHPSLTRFRSCVFVTIPTRNVSEGSRPAVSPLSRSAARPIQPAHSSCTDSASWQVSFHNPKAEFGSLSVLIRRTEQTVLRFRNTASLPNKSPILPAVSTDWLETAGTGIADIATAASWNSELVCFRVTRGQSRKVRVANRICHKEPERDGTYDEPGTCVAFQK